MATPQRYTVTAALPYANGPVHIGHLAGCYLPADIYVRYLRQQGRDVQFICGTDEHGVAINLKAQAEGCSPKEIVDRYHEVIRKGLEGIGCSFDIFSRTSKAIHRETAQDFFTKLYEQGSLVEKTTEQYYDTQAESFLADRYIQGTCPNCGFEEAYGDQCESCGSSLSPMELKNPVSRLSGGRPERRETTHWFLPLDHLSGKIEQYIRAHGHWKPNVYGQCMSWLQSGDGLQARSMTRDLDWGVPVPLPQAEGKVLYVWFDAPIGYISATKELLGERWTDYWQREDTKLVHFIGKDNIVFHCITFPSMLMEHGDYHLPDEVPANEFLNLEGRKISTSRNWAVWLHEYVADFPGKEDALRYCLCANAPETKDNDFTWKDFQNRNNNELVAVLGNFVNRVLVLLNKYYDGKLPEVQAPTAAEEQLQKARRQAPDRVAAALERYRFREAQLAMMQLAREGNKYLTEEEPWKTQKTDPSRTEAIMHEAAQTAALLSQLMEPFLPFAAARLRGYLQLDLIPWEKLSDGDLLPAGHRVEKGDLLFEKVSDEAVEAQKQKLEEPAPAEEKHPPLKEEMDFETFTQQDLRVGTITAAEEMPKADKLLKLSVNLGFEQRTIVSGIRQHFDAAHLPGQRVTVVANLAPRKLRGVESQGMILMAENADGMLHFVAPPAEAENGAVVR